MFKMLQALLRQSYLFLIFFGLADCQTDIDFVIDQKTDDSG